MCRCMLLLFACLNVLPSFAGVLVTPDSTWRFFKGYSEASTPDTTAWRQLGFDDSAWVTSQAAFYYDNQPGSSTAYTGNTVLTDMFGNYTCIFLRQTFVVTNVYDAAEYALHLLRERLGGRLGLDSLGHACRAGEPQDHANRGRQPGPGEGYQGDHGIGPHANRSKDRRLYHRMATSAC